LTRPSTEFGNSYKQSLQEQANESRNISGIDSQIADIDTHINWLQSLEQPRDKRHGVQQSVFWLVNGNNYIGTIIIRHKLSGRHPSIASHVYYEIRPSERENGYGKLILKLGIQEASSLNLKFLIASCDADNIPSLEIIKYSGGTLFARRIIRENGAPVTVLLFKIRISRK